MWRARRRLEGRDEGFLHDSRVFHDGAQAGLHPRREDGVESARARVGRSTVDRTRDERLVEMPESGDDRSALPFSTPSSGAGD